MQHMSEDNYSHPQSDFNPESAKEIQGLADLLTNMLVTENSEETELSLSVKKSNKSQNQNQEIVINSPTETGENGEVYYKEEIKTVDISPPNTDDSSRIIQTTHNVSTSLYQNESKGFIPLVKPEPKSYAQNKFLETEIQGLRGLLVDLESRVYNHQELINLLLPTVTETIRDKITQREGAIANIFKPGEGKTITEQIEQETEVLMEALYPVIGVTIGDYIASTIRKVNSQVSDAIDNSSTGNQNLKITSLTPEELEEQTSNYFRVNNVFLIHKKSHLIITEKQHISHKVLSSEVITSMLSSIRNLSYKLTRKSQFLSIEYNENKINIYSGENAYLAVMAQGEAPTNFLQLLAKILDELEKEYETSIKMFQGDQTIIPESLTNKLQPILEFEVNKEIKRRNRRLVGGSLIGLLLIGLPLGIYQYWQYRNYRVEQEIIANVSEDEDLKVYNLDVDITEGKINLLGRLPNEYLKQKLTSVVQKYPSDLPIDNQVSVVDLPLNQGDIEKEIEEVLKIFNQIDGIDIKTYFNKGVLTLTGKALQLTELEDITASFARINGIKQINNQIDFKPVQIPLRLYFSRNTANVSARDVEGKLIPIKDEMELFPNTQLTIFGYRSRNESRNISLKRAQSVQTSLEDLGIDRRRIRIEDGKGVPPDVKPNQEQWLNQAVVFELK